MNIRKLSLLLVSAVVIFSAGGCAKPAATVNGKKIDRKTYDLHVKEKVQEQKQQGAPVDEKKLGHIVIQELINEALVLDEARARGIKVSDSEVDKEIEGIRNKMGAVNYDKALKDKGLTAAVFRERHREKMMMSRFLEGLAKEVQVTDEDIQNYYKNSARPFLKPSRVMMKTIEIESEGSAVAAMNEMKSGHIDFDEMGTRLVKENKANVTGYGWVSPDFFSPEMARAIKGLPVGHYGGPYKGKKSYFLVKVKEKENERIATFDEVKDEIKTSLAAERQQVHISEWLAAKRKAAKIEINIK